jgi:ferritin-like protein
MHGKADRSEAVRVLHRSGQRRLMSDYHEPYEALDDNARDTHRALTSLKEEIEAVDWYHQRVVLCRDPVLQAVLAHNRDEEMEHACMALEWLRRRMPGWDAALRSYVFTEGPIRDRTKDLERGERPGDGDAAPAPASGDLGIRSLRPSGASGKEP